MSDQDTRATTLPIVAVAAAFFCFSAGPVGVVVQRLLVGDFSPFLIVATQMTIGAATLWLMRMAFPVAQVRRIALLKGLALGLIHPGAFMIIYTAASGRLDSITAVLLLALVPALVAVGGRLILKEALKPVVLVGIAVSIAGLVVLASERQVTGENSALGFVLSIIGLLVASGSVITGRAFNTGAVLPWYLLAPLQVTGAAIIAWAGVVFTGVEVDLSAMIPHWQAFAYLALGMTAASYFAYNFVLSRLPTPTVGLLSAAGPGMGAVAASVIFATRVGPVEAAGIAIILAGAALPPIWGLISRQRGTGQAPSAKSADTAVPASKCQT